MARTNALALLFFVLSLFLVWGKQSSPTSPATIFGFKTKNQIVLSGTSKYAPNGMKLRSNYPWIRSIGEHTVIAASGDECDCETLFEEVMSEYMIAEVTFDQRSPPMTTEEIARFCRYRIVKALRKKALQINLLVGGFTPSQSESLPCLYWIDELGTMKPCAYAAFGRELPFLLSLLDHMEEEYSLGSKKNGIGLQGIVDESEINDIINYCWKVIQKRSNQELESHQTKVLKNPFSISSSQPTIQSAT